MIKKKKNKKNLIESPVRKTKYSDEFMLLNFHCFSSFQSKCLYTSKCQLNHNNKKPR